MTVKDSSPSPINKKIIPLLISILIVLSVPNMVQAVVTLVSFTADPAEDAILIEWETATEFDNAGFYLTRSTEVGGDYDTISDFIPAEGSGVIGANYLYTDTEVTAGPVYYYILDAVNTNQEIESHGPISTTLDTEEPTLTATSTFTGTETATITPSSTQTFTPSPTDKTSTPSLTPTRTNTSSPTIPPPPTHTPVVTSPPTPTQTLTPSFTPSVAPIPDIILQAPEITQPTMTFAPRMIPALAASPSSGNVQNRVISSYRPLLIVLIVLLWFVVAGGIFYFWYTSQNPGGS